MCSTTRGPAIWPSLVTWPTRMTAAPERLAKRISACAAPRTCVTVPGAESTASVHMVWIESMTTRRGVLPSRQRRDDVLDRGLGRELDRRVGEAEPLGAQPHLRDGFLAGDVDGAVAGARERRRGLDQQRRFADAGIARHQQHRAAHEAAAGDAVEFGDAGGQARRVLRLAGERLEREQRGPCAARGPGRRGGAGAFLGDRVPLAAGVALALPAAVGGAAVLADEGLGCAAMAPGLDAT